MRAIVVPSAPYIHDSGSGSLSCSRSNVTTYMLDAAGIQEPVVLGTEILWFPSLGWWCGNNQRT